MKKSPEQIHQLLEELAQCIENNMAVDAFQYEAFIDAPELAIDIIALIALIEEQSLDDHRSFYSACLFAFELSISQLQSAIENGSKHAKKWLETVMEQLAKAIDQARHSLSFWLPVLNAFYEVHIELSESLQNAYLMLAHSEELSLDEGGVTSIHSIRDLLLELSDLNDFDIAENFFAQSYAMPPAFFAELILDLYSIPEGHEPALLMLLHPKAEVREIVSAVFDQIIEQLTLSPKALSRLQAIKAWYPPHAQTQFDQWIKIQRKKGVVFASPIASAPNLRIHATEVDGSGAQGLFIHLKNHRKNRLAGFLLKKDVGLKEVWITPMVSSKEASNYYDKAFNDSVELRAVDLDYIQLIIQHFLQVTLDRGQMPGVHLLEIQEALNIHFVPKIIDAHMLLNDLIVHIAPFTPMSVQASLLRSKSWANKKQFTESWFVEHATIDKSVNRHASFIDGIKVCQTKDAMEEVFANVLERKRQDWLFHFLWVALWLKAKAKPNEKTWQDALIIAYTIAQDTPLSEIPIMHAICYQSITNSMETMQERRTYLAQEVVA